MYTRAFVKNLILPSVSIGVVRAEGKEDDCDNTRKLVRPRDLALYVDPPKCLTCSNTVETEDGFLLTTIRCARQELQSVLEQARVIQAEATSMLDNIKKETSDAVSYLQQEENLLPRMGAIGFGAFAGYILAVRKGILKKILYSAAGAGAIAAVAYPNEAREYSEEVFCELKKYAVIGYHFVNGADVDWKKLNEKYHCFEKKGISGRSVEPGSQENDGKVTQPADPTRPGKPAQLKPGEDEAASQAEPGNSTEVPNPGSSNGSNGKAPSPQTGPGKVADAQSAPAIPDEPLPQDRPQNAKESRPYKSYSEECKAKSACAMKQRSNPKTPPDDGRQNRSRRGSSSPLPADERVSAEKRINSNPDYNGSRMQSSCPRNAQGGRVSGGVRVETEPGTNQMEPRSGRPNTADSRQSQMRSSGLPSGSPPASRACSLPDVNTQRPRSSDRSEYSDAEQSQMDTCFLGRAKVEPGAAQFEPNRQGGYAQMPRTAGPSAGLPCGNRSDFPQARPSSSSSQRSSLSPCPFRRSSSNAPSARYQEPAQSQSVDEQQQTGPPSRGSADEGRFQCPRGEAPQIECGSPSANGKPPAPKP